MRTMLRTLALSAVLAAPLSAQGLMAEMHRDASEVQGKIISLVKAMPDASMGWRPGPGARTTKEVFLHISSDNYLIPIAMGMPAPAGSGITSDFATAAAYEKKEMTRDQIVADLEASFTHLHKAMLLTTDTNLNETIKFFGQDWTRQRAMVLTITHLHEHLGQLIAHARANNVTPPWSK